MSPKERRDRLLKGKKPLVRNLEVLNGESYSDDMKILWAAYKAGSFQLPELTPDEFARLMEQDFSNYSKVFVIDDNNKAFGSGRGPVALVAAVVSGLVVKPKAIFFKWATKKNILRCSVSFINMLKHSSKTGMCIVETTKDKRNLPDHLKNYDMLYFIGKASDNEYIYSIRGRGSD